MLRRLYREGTLLLDDDPDRGYETMSTDQDVALPALIRYAGDPMCWCVWDEADIGMITGRTLNLETCLELFSYKRGNNPNIVLDRMVRLAAIGLINPVGGRLEKWEFTPGLVGDEFRNRTFDVVMDAFNDEFQLIRKQKK